jgi:hypothetical protein
VQSNAADTKAPCRLWLIEHERESPMVLTQSEHAREDACSALGRILKAHIANGFHVDPPFSTIELGRRYDVHDANGWAATYWLSEEKLAEDDGILTAVMSPAVRQRANVTQTSKPH